MELTTPTPVPVCLLGSVLGIGPLAESAESNAAHADWATTWPKCGNAAAGILHTLPVERQRSGPAPIPRPAQRGSAAGERGAARVCHFRGHTRGLNSTIRWTSERTRGCAGLNLESQTPHPDLRAHAHPPCAVPSLPLAGHPVVTFTPATPAIRRKPHESLDFPRGPAPKSSHPRTPALRPAHTRDAPDETRLLQDAARVAGTPWSGNTSEIEMSRNVHLARVPYNDRSGPRSLAI